MKKHTFNNLTATLGGNRKQKRITEHHGTVPFGNRFKRTREEVDRSES